MSLLHRITPYIYGIVLFAFAVLGTANAIFIEGAHLSFLHWSEALGTTYMWLSLSLAFVFIVAFVIQIAVLDLHQDKQYAEVESRRRFAAVLVRLFMLALPPVAAMGIHARYAAQMSWGYGFWSEGSIVYIVCGLFVAMFFLLWGMLRQALPQT